MINIEQFIADIKGMTVLELADLVKAIEDEFGDRKSTRLNSSHSAKSRMPSSA